MLAVAAAIVVVIHDTLADLGLAGGHSRADRHPNCYAYRDSDSYWYTDSHADSNSKADTNAQI